MQIYIACLASYNNGVLHGRWIDASSDVSEMQEQVDAMLRDSKFPNVTVTHPDTGEQVPSAEEYAIHDFDGVPASFGEYCGLQKVADFVKLVEDFGYICPDVANDIATVVEEFGGAMEYASEMLNDNFAGVYTSFREYSDECADELIGSVDGCANQTLINYFDYEAYAHDLKMGMIVVELDHGVMIFYP